jgi:hypothetical protein
VIKNLVKAIVFSILCVSTAHAQSLPAGSIGSVTNPATNVNNLYTFNFTPTTTGSDYVGFAFRQDPAYWSFTNPVLEVQGTTTNLLTNANLSAGGPVQVTTNSGTQTIQAPANWGVWYQNGTYPAAAGTWQSGQWYDGAVGSYDGIYQGVALTAGTHYVITFDALSTYQASSNAQAMIGVYAGACQSVSLAASACTPNTTSFTPLAVPAQTVNAGNPSAPPVANPASAPTVVSTAPGTPIVTTASSLGTSVTTTSVAYGTSTVVPVTTNGTTTFSSSYVDQAVNQGNDLTVTRTTTVVARTPFTTVTTTTVPVYTTTVVTVPHITTTTTTPTTVTTYSDGTTSTANGTPVVTSTTNNVATSSVATTYNISSTTQTGTISQSAVGSQSANATASGLRDAVAARNTNPFLVDILSQRDGGWISPSAAYFKTVGSMASGGVSWGYQTTVENNTAGVAFNYNKAISSGLDNNSISSENFAATAYMLSKQEFGWLKAQLGFGTSAYNSSNSIPLFSLYNTEKFRQNQFYADLGIYGASTFMGFRPLIGATIVNSQIGQDSITGSQLLATAPAQGSTTQVNPYLGARYDFDTNFGVETRVTQTKDFSTVFGIRGVAQTEISKGIFLNASAGFDRSKNYTGAVGTVGLKIEF